MLENLSSLSTNIIFGVLSIVLFGLGIYFGILMSKLNAQKKQIKEIQIQRDEALKEREQFLKNSILILSRAAINEQCELSEACIRIKKLLENYPQIETRSEFSVIQNMYTDLSNFDYLEERAKLSSKEKFSQDKQRFKVEDTYKIEMLKSLNLLIKHFDSHQ